jgi:hypothetical protein
MDMLSVTERNYRRARLAILLAALFCFTLAFLISAIVY